MGTVRGSAFLVSCDGSRTRQTRGVVSLPASPRGRAADRGGGGSGSGSNGDADDDGDDSDDGDNDEDGDTARHGEHGTPTRSRDLTAARGDVDVNRGRDARNHNDRRTDRTIVRDRFSALLFLSFSPFSSSRVFISTAEVFANRRPPSCFLAVASGTDRNGATAGRDGTGRTDGQTDAAQLAAAA